MCKIILLVLVWSTSLSGVNTDIWKPEGKVQQALYGVAVDNLTEYELDVISAVCEITEPIIALSSNDIECVMAINDWLVDNVRFSYDVRHIYTEDTALHILEERQANCGGYSGLFELFCLSAGIRTRVVHGEAGGWFHAWNEVVVDGETSYVDVTWNATGDDRYAWLLITSDVFYLTHVEMSVMEWIHKTEVDEY